LATGVNCYLDRFEGKLAVILVDGVEKTISASLLPTDAREGDHLLIAITCDTDARNRTAAEISDLQKELETGNGGS